MKILTRMSIAAAALLAVALCAYGAEQNQPSAKELSEEAAARARQHKFDFKRPEYQDQDRVRELAKQGRARGQAELDRMVKQHQAQPGVSKETQAKQGDEPQRPIVAGRVVVALSSSMPEMMLRDYVAQLDGRPEAVVVLRGFVGGAKAVGPTGKLIELVRRKVIGDPRGGHRAVEVIVDPLVYRNLGIDKVPALAWLPGVQDIKHCDQENYQTAVVVYGASSVEAALREINRNGGTVPPEVLKKFGGRGWEQGKG